MFKEENLRIANAIKNIYFRICTCKTYIEQTKTINYIQMKTIVALNIIFGELCLNQH